MLGRQTAGGRKGFFLVNVWGVHNDSLTSELVEEGFISVGWDGLGALSDIADGRDGFKRALNELEPDAKPRSVAGQAGVLVRFRDEMQMGDVVVAPYKPNSTINIGVVIGSYYYDSSAATHRHRRKIEWNVTDLPRTVFSQSALYEIGSVLTVFRVRTHAEEFLAALAGGHTSVDELARQVDIVADRLTEDEEPDEPRASRISRQTRDFVLDSLHRRLSHQDFEVFTAELLRVLGYQARVTQYSQDGGVDVIAHRDPLGVEPPQIKVQCKHHTGTISAPEVQQLVGTQGPSDLALFVTLGTYSKDARMIERQRNGLRLLSGEDIVTLVLDNYFRLPEERRSLIPLAQVLVVSDEADR